jgi:CRP-like cAMP-binding protein
MQEELLKSLSKYVEITEDLKIALQESAFVKTYPKGTLLLKEGDLCKACYFILKGCIRSYLIKDGVEKTTEFYTEEQVVTLSSYGTDAPSQYYLQCTEDTIVSVGTPEMEEKMFEKYPQLEKMGRVMSNAIMTQMQDKLSEFKHNSPEEQYLSLQKTRPDLEQRVPQYQLASYLGITPESLSRIRKRISKN